MIFNFLGIFGMVFSSCVFIFHPCIFIKLLLINLFGSFEFTENSKKRRSATSNNRCSFRILVRVSLCSCVCFLHPRLDVNHLFLFRQACNP